MGRAKLKLQFIENRKLRLSTLKRRKEGLEKKLHELTTLCDVPACMIIHDPFTNSTYIWPDDSAQVRLLIDSYKANPSAVKAFGLSDFFKEELVKKDAETEFPTWDYRLDLMDESQLRELSVGVRAEAEAVRSRIDFMKREAMMKEENNNSNVMLDLEEIVDQDEIFSIADDMATTNADLNLNLPQPLKREAVMKNSNNVILDLDKFEEIVDRDDFFSIVDVMVADANAQLPVPDDYCPPPLNLPQPAMMKNNNSNVVLDLDDFEDIVDEDGRFCIADVMAVAMSAANAQLPVPDYYCPQQDYTFSVADVMAAMSGNRQLALPDYYCSQPLDLPQTFMDHNHLNRGYCSSMDVNWFAGDDGGDLASYLWH
ncbi:MADS-box protein FLOWERING LOCUS C-like [Salvia divinorum]|uniref:MADS-box protein FLOWERING LOCUS C-like n=1 Tax=Salvia divinorum TaxID=28513 RepID=A0ABD1ICJ4_SALDI